MQEKKCMICGRTIGPSETYYSYYPNFICAKNNCFETYYWKSFLDNYPYRLHEYAIIDGVAYVIGNETDDPRGFSGRKFTIQFFDGTIITTFSLWYKGTIPDSLRESLPDNARFV